MKVQILGLSTRMVTNKDSGVIRYYTNLYYQTNFLQSEIDSGARGIKCDKVNTAIDCSLFNPGDVVNFDYGPTGYKNQDGSDQIRLQSIDLVEPAKSK